MSIYLESYQPFQMIQSHFQKAKTEIMAFPLKKFLEIAKKIISLAITIFLFIPLLIIDATITISSLFTRASSPAAAPTQNLPPTADQLFFQKSTTVAFNLLKLNKAVLYRELIRYDNEMPPPRYEHTKQPIEEHAPIDIFKWTAANFIAHYIRTKNSGVTMANNLFLESVGGIQLIFKTFQEMELSEKNNTIMKIVDAEEDLELSAKTEVLINEIQAKALELTQNQQFIRSIYNPSKAAILLKLDSLGTN